MSKSELKTLSDIEDNVFEGGITSPCHCGISRDKLRAEAIKWWKESEEEFKWIDDDKLTSEKAKAYMNYHRGRADAFKDFFNLTSSDLQEKP